MNNSLADWFTQMLINSLLSRLVRSRSTPPVSWESFIDGLWAVRMAAGWRGHCISANSYFWWRTLSWTASYRENTLPCRMTAGAARMVWRYAQKRSNRRPCLISRWVYETSPGWERALFCLNATHKMFSFRATILDIWVRAGVFLGLYIIPGPLNKWRRLFIL